MAYKCTFYGKILVGPKKTCEICDKGSLESKCEYRVWQEGVLKVRKEKRGRKQMKSLIDDEPLPLVVGLSISCLTNLEGTYLIYIRRADGRYHYSHPHCSRPIPENMDVVRISILEELTEEDIRFLREKNWDYNEILKRRG